MNRVSTAGNYQSALLNLMNAQAQQQDAQNRVSTQKIATDQAGFGRGAESLTALKAAQNRVQGFLDTGDAVVARLESQDLALNQVGDAISAAKTAIGEALASESTNVFMLAIQNQFSAAQSGLNAQHQGTYLFGGANSTNPPVTVDTLAELTATPAADVFANDTLAPISRLGETSSVKTGYLADEVGAEVFQIFREIQAYNDGPNGPLTGKPTDAQKEFLTLQMGKLGTASTNVINVIARNGSVQKQIEATNTSNAAQVSALGEMVNKKTDADLAKAVTDLQLSQIAVQASAQVISQLSQVSLLNYLR